MNASTRIARLGSAAAAAAVLASLAVAGPATAKNGADDASPPPSSTAEDRTTTRPSDASTHSATPSASASSSASASDSASGSSSASASDSASSSGRGGRVERIVRGGCTAGAKYKLKAKSRDGGLEVEFEVDSNRNGQRWTYTIRHDGQVRASGTRTTRAPSGSFSVERRLADEPGTHAVTATARNSRTGQVCRAALTI